MSSWSSIPDIFIEAPVIIILLLFQSVRWAIVTCVSVSFSITVAGSDSLSRTIDEEFGTYEQLVQTRQFYRSSGDYFLTFISPLGWPTCPYLAKLTASSRICTYDCIISITATSTSNSANVLVFYAIRTAKIKYRSRELKDVPPYVPARSVRSVCPYRMQLLGPTLLSQFSPRPGEQRIQRLAGRSAPGRGPLANWMTTWMTTWIANNQVRYRRI